MKRIFSIAPVENLEKWWDCFLMEKHSPDVGLRGIRHCVSSVLLVSGVSKLCDRTLTSDVC